LLSGAAHAQSSCTIISDIEAIWRVFLFAVKAFLAQAKEDFNQKWESPAQVRCDLVNLSRLISDICESLFTASTAHTIQ